MHVQSGQTVVIKIGSSTIFDAATNTVRLSWLRTFAQDLKKMVSRQVWPLVFCSGAVAAGRPLLPVTGLAASLQFQLAGALGQQVIFGAWITTLHDLGLRVLPLILSGADVQKNHYVEVFAGAKSSGLIPVVNENIPFQVQHNNDDLALEIAKSMQAHQLWILTDTDGLFNANPRTNPSAQHIPVIDANHPPVMQFDADVNSIGSGGASSKLTAGLQAAAAGIKTVILNGTVDNPLQAVWNKQQRYTTIAPAGGLPFE